MKQNAPIVVLMATLLLWATLSAQDAICIQGVITDKNQEPIIDAYIVSYNSANVQVSGTVSDYEGRYNFRVPVSKHATYLVVSFIGYFPDTVYLSEAPVQTYNIVLSPDYDSWDKIVVVSGCSTPPAQENVSMEEDTTIYLLVDTMPSFPGGNEALFKFLEENVQWPHPEMDGQCRVICQFVVEKDGKITNLSVQRSCGYDIFDNEAVRVISIMPNWTPGYKDGKPVRVKYVVPINFKIVG